MRAVILGGGVVGVTTAYFLAKAGCEVVVIEQRDSVAAEASAINAGAIAPGHSFSWASPKAPGILFRSLVSSHTALKVHPSGVLDPDLITWGVRFLRECSAARARHNTLVKHRLCTYSQHVLDGLVAREQISYDRVERGMLYLYRDAKKLEAGIAQMQLLVDHGQQMDFLDASGCVRIEPALAPAAHKLAGGIHATTDSTGDPVKFTLALAERVTDMGGTIQLGTRITGIDATSDHVDGVLTDKGVIRGEVYVLALGAWSPILSRSIGVRLPIYPVKGLSITATIVDDQLAPNAGGVDEALLVGWSRMGDRLRMTSTADFCGYSSQIKRKEFDTIFELAETFFPGAADYQHAQLRSGLRPMTPGGPPTLGKGKHQNLWYNTGHGHMGWTMSCGSAQLISNMILNRDTDIPLDGLTLS